MSDKQAASRERDVMSGPDPDEQDTDVMEGADPDAPTDVLDGYDPGRGPGRPHTGDGDERSSR